MECCSRFPTAMASLTSPFCPTQYRPTFQFPNLCHHRSPAFPITSNPNLSTRTCKNGVPYVLRSSDSAISSLLLSSSESENDEDIYTEDEEGTAKPPQGLTGSAPPVRRKRRRYRKQYPGEKNGITQEMRFVTMKLRNSGKPKGNKDKSDVKNESDCDSVSPEEDGNGENGEAWEPSLDGFLKYLVDSRLIFSTIESVVDESSHVSYAYFRKTGLERSECLSRDLEWLSQQGSVVPKPSNPGISYAKYLEELAEESPPLFLCHFYNIYFSHIAGGQVIAKQVSMKLLEGREVEFFKWEGNEEELLKGVREKLNMLGEHWSRDEKNKCLRETTKAFRFLGQIIRLIIL